MILKTIIILTIPIYRIWHNWRI